LDNVLGEDAIERATKAPAELEQLDSEAA